METQWGWRHACGGVVLWFAAVYVFDYVFGWTA